MASKKKSVKSSVETNRSKTPQAKKSAAAKKTVATSKKGDLGAARVAQRLVESRKAWNSYGTETGTTSRLQIFDSDQRATMMSEAALNRMFKNKKKK
jgi:hypothetical protein